MQQLCSVPSMRYLVIPKRFLPSLSMLCPSGQRFGQLHGSGPQRQSTIHICANSWSSQKTRYLSTAAVEEYEPITKTVPFLLADIGEGIAEVELLQWYVGKGEKIAQFDRVCEVQSDKATVEITSRYDGVVESLCGEIGDMIDVGSPLLHISIVDTEAQPEERHSSIQPHLSVLHRINDEPDKLLIPPGRGMTRDLSVSAISTSTLQNKVKSTPAVRKIGKENGLDLGTVKGTGPKGRILKSDVLQLINEKTQLSVNDGIMSLASTRRYAPCLSSHEDETVPIRGFNRLMCKTMTASLQIPHMCYADEINMNAVLKCRKDLQSTAERHGVKLSLLAFAIKAASLAMKEYRIMNSSLDADEYMLTYKANHNIGVAMDTPRGLVVPVIKSCQNLSIFEIARELERLKQCAFSGNLAEDDISGGTFTISNIGAIGGTYMSPIVSSPQVAIGAMGKIQRLPRYVGDHVEEVNIMQISWGGDHRVIDGATMARFSNKWKDFLESPITMIVSMK